MVSNRIKLALVMAFVLGVPIVGFAYLTPPNFLSSAWYWSGFVGFFLYGMFLLGPNGPISPIAGKVKGRSRGHGYIPVGLTAVALVLIGRFFPGPNEAVFAIPVSLFGGIGLRLAYLLAFQSRWAFCPKCEKKSWILELDGKWYCNKKGHVVDIKATANEPRSEQT